MTSNSDMQQWAELFENFSFFYQDINYLSPTEVDMALLELEYRALKLQKKEEERKAQEERAKKIAEYDRRRGGMRARGAPRKVWTRTWITKRVDYGIYDKAMQEIRCEDPAAFKKMTRMPTEMFDELLDRVGPRITKRDTHWRKAIPPGMKLAVTLKHLATGDTYVSQMFGWRIPHNTQSVIVREVCQAIVDEYMRDVMVCPTTPEEWLQIAEQFEKRWNFPHCLGAMDGKHVAIKAPANSGSLYYNYKNFHSIVLFALVDADYKFIWADIGGRGAASDAQIYNASALKERIDNGTAGFPADGPLTGCDKDVPYYIVGDEAFALCTTLMKPYQRRNMGREERVFNYRLSRARRVVENAFGILANRFQIFLSKMRHQPETVKLIIKTCLVLHNILRTRYPTADNNALDQAEGEGSDYKPGPWRRNFNLVDTDDTGTTGHRGSNAGKDLRILLTKWVNSEEGAVPWQNRVVFREDETAGGDGNGDQGDGVAAPGGDGNGDQGDGVAAPGGDGNGDQGDGVAAPGGDGNDVSSDHEQLDMCC